MIYRFYIGIILVFFFNNTLMAIETPKYQVILQENGFELREYEPMVIALTQVESSYREATVTGFRRIANYIFGGNSRDVSIEMTAPVISNTPNSNDAYEILFVMPSEYSFNELPDPNFENIAIKEFNLGKVVVLQFGGWATKERVIKYKNKLKDIVTDKGYKTDGNYLVAQYNSPYALPPFRKNEILVKIK
jgi:hypothetical protein|tara:strand:- start:5647 stop:6219 length:573 start_codon:yes stop_codon:yes gene_type:complete